MDWVFTYGTLRRGGGHSHLLGSGDRSVGWVSGRLLHLPAGYPALVEDFGPGRVRGEWVEVPDLPLRIEELDRYEGVGPAPDGLYQRVRRPVHGPGSPRWAFVYVMPRLRAERALDQGAEWVDGEDWIAFFFGT